MRSDPNHFVPVFTASAAAVICLAAAIVAGKKKRGV
jgi:hypothetical protein